MELMQRQEGVRRRTMRQVVVVIRERALSGTSLGGTLPAVFSSEDAAASFSGPRLELAALLDPGPERALLDQDLAHAPLEPRAAVAEGCRQTLIPFVA